MKLRRKLALDYYLGGVLHMLLKPPTVALGMLLGRDHDLSNCSSVTIIKMLGGGSLVIAYPSLLAIRNSPRVETLRIVTTPALRPFAETLGIFDEIIVIRENSLLAMAGDSMRAIARLFRCDAIVDLEVHSRLSTVFSLLTCARNRIGFYTSIAFWRKGLSTHLIFCNVSNGIYHFYDQIAQLFGGVVPDVDTFREAFRSQMPLSEESPPAGVARIGIAPCCSDLARERQLSSDEWVAILRGHLNGIRRNRVEIFLMGAPSDRAFLDALAKRMCSELPGIHTQNMAGRASLRESVALLRSMDVLISIDSALLHFGRLIGVKTISYWGPTNPATLLRPEMVVDEEVFYQRVSCSPCIHVADRPPCNGNNVCMRAAASVLPARVRNLNPTWLVEGAGTLVARPEQAKTGSIRPEVEGLTVISGDSVSCDMSESLQRLAHAVANKERVEEPEKASLFRADGP